MAGDRCPLAIVLLRENEDTTFLKHQLLEHQLLKHQRPRCCWEGNVKRLPNKRKRENENEELDLKQRCLEILPSLRRNGVV